MDEFGIGEERSIYTDRHALGAWFAEHAPGDVETGWYGCSLDDGEVFHIAPGATNVHSVSRPARVVLRRSLPGLTSTAVELLAEATLAGAGAPEPLVLVELVPAGDGYIPQAAAVDTGRAWSAALRYFAVETELQSRASGLVPTGTLGTRRIGVVGVGSGGSTIAVELAKAGVGNFVLIDHDRLEVANVARHACGLGDVGRRKTFAVRDLIRGRNPAAVVETHEFDILRDPDRLRRVVANCDLLIGATDTDPSRSLVNRVAVEHGITALFGRVLAGAYAGDVMRVRPRAGACLACVFTAAMRAAKPREITGMSEARAAFPAYTDEAVLEQVIQVGLASDIAPVAGFMVKLSLSELLRGQAGALASLEEDFQSDFYTWVNRRERLYRSFRPLGQGLPNIMSWIPGPATQRPECSVCGAAQSGPGAPG